MPLPTSREYTASSSAPIQSAAFNVVQDCIVGSKHQTRTIKLPILPPGATPGTADVSFAAAWCTPIIVPVGRRITAVRFVIRDSATGPTTLRATILTAVAAIALGSVAFGAASAGNASVQTIALTGQAVTVVSGSVYYAGISFATGSATCHVYDAECDYDNL